MTKKIFVTTLLILKLNSLLAQLPSIAWERCYGGTEADNCFASCEAHDGNYIIAGTCNSDNGDFTGPILGVTDIVLLKIDSSSGAIIWQRNLGGTDYDNCYSVVKTNDGGYILTGESKSPFIPGAHGISSYDMYVCKVDSLGNLQWHHCYGGSNDDGGAGVIQMPDSTFLVSGYTRSITGNVSFNHGNYDYWVIHVDTQGNLLWEKTYGGTLYDRIYCMTQSDSGHYLLGGASNSLDGDVTGNHGGTDYWIAEIDSAGNLIWENSFGGPGDDICFGICQSSGKIYCGGLVYSGGGDVTNFHGGFSDGWVAKLSMSGQLLSERAIGGSGSAYISSIHPINDNSFLISGEAASTDYDFSGITLYGGSDYLAGTIDSSLNIHWVNNYGGNSGEYSASAFNTSDNKIVLAGASNSSSGQVTGWHSNPNGLYDVWVVKLDSDIALSSNNLLGSDEVLVYPNPFRNDILIKGVGNNSHVFIYDIKCKTVFSKLYQEKGGFLKIATEQLPSGFYILKIVSDSSIYNFKILKQ